jgi:hypothetical protein
MRRGEVFDRLAELTRRQLGLVTRAQAGRVGVPDRELLRYLCARDLERVAHGVYRFRRDLDDLHQPLWAAWLQLDPARTAAERVAGPGVPDAIVSHESAADIYWIGNLYADIHTFTVSEPRTSGRRDVRLVAAPLQPDEWEVVDGLPLTRPQRIVADLLTDGRDGGHVASVALHALRQGQVTEAELVAALAPFSEGFGLPPDDGADLLYVLGATEAAEFQTPGS